MLHRKGWWTISKWKVLKPGDRVYFKLKDDAALRNVPKHRKESMATVMGYTVKFMATPEMRQVLFRIHCDRKVLDSRIWNVKRARLRLVKACAWTDKDYER